LGYKTSILVQTKHRERQLLQSELNIAQNALRTIFLHIARWLYDFCMEIELSARVYKSAFYTIHSPRPRCSERMQHQLLSETQNDTVQVLNDKHTTNT